MRGRETSGWLGKHLRASEMPRLIPTLVISNHLHGDRLGHVERVHHLPQKKGAPELTRSSLALYR